MLATDMEVRVQDDLLVVGFDLETRREVHVTEQPPEHWIRRGYGGTGQLVCFYCFHGFEAPAGTRVPLLTRGRLGGKVRRHFAHPPNQAPVGGHNPETVWHITTKHALARWARTRPGVAEVQMERWTPQKDRRADVAVRLNDGTRLALEAQRMLMTDDAWRIRHRDYLRQGIVDVWFWRPGVQFPHIVLDERLPVWFYVASKGAVWTALGRPHAQRHRWWQADNIAVFGLHHPPCALDDLERQALLLDQLNLGPHGAVLPDAVLDMLRSSQSAAREEAAKWQESEARYARQLREAERQRSEDARRLKPPPPPPAGGLRCHVCKRPLASELARAGRHILC
ncbi:competence protein CoiA family protein [Streptomyces sp.]|uniref:competence protein CoiA family protein n=1 Tax=Streptomyces sp. TaxID=1931 RepID=UPI002D78696A|nr:competence protein CoiA family protein [Streptomyces sp.]HET6353765.1 competence protein CoiA family protein [Streptomyces sp.]